MALGYAPPLEDAKTIGDYVIAGRYRAILRRHPPVGEQTQRIKYLYSLEAVTLFDGDAVLCVAAEINETAPGAGSHFLGVFIDDGHENHGASDDWGDQRRFADAALEIVCDRLGCAADEVLDIWKGEG